MRVRGVGSDRVPAGRGAALSATFSAGDSDGDRQWLRGVLDRPHADDDLLCFRAADFGLDEASTGGDDRGPRGQRAGCVQVAHEDPCPVPAHLGE